MDDEVRGASVQGQRLRDGGVELRTSLRLVQVAVVRAEVDVAASRQGRGALQVAARRRG